MALELLSVAQFAQRTSTSPWTIRYHISVGHIKSTRIGKRVLVPSTEVERIAAEGLPHIPVASKQAAGGLKP